MIYDRPDLTLQAVLADQLRRIRHALIFIIVAVATACRMGAGFERLEIGFGVQTVMQEIKNQALAQ